MKPHEMDKRAGNLLKNRLLTYQKPHIDTILERDLVNFVDQRKGKLRNQYLVAKRNKKLTIG